MSDLISKSLNLIGSKNPNAFVIQIGANDGVSFDDTRGFLDMYKWPALLVEPIPDYFNQLKDNFIDRDNYIFENSAITPTDGPIEMLTVSQKTIEDNNLHPGYKGMSALYPLKNGFGTDYERDIYVKDNLAKNIKVNGITFPSLLAKHNISKFDVLICDAEGHDWAIFKQLDLTKYRPKVIRLEYINLNKEEQQLLIQKLEAHNYEYEVSGQDIDAVDTLWVKDLNLSENPTTSLEELSLNSIIEKYGSDKLKSGYSHFYESIFSSYKNKPINYLEIGLGTVDPSIPSSFCGIYSHYEHYTPGAILKAWKEYFPNGQIYGIDVAPDCMINEDRIQTKLGSSTDSSFSKSFYPEVSFDIILDDGLHTADAQIQTFFNFFDKVKDGGIYIIEDIGGGGDGKNVFVNYKEELLSVISKHEYFYGGNVLIIRKNNSQKSSLSLKDFSCTTSQVEKLTSTNNNNNLTIVSGLWDINRVGRDWSRYEEHFDKFLKIPCNMVLWIPKSLESFVWERRSKENTFVRLYELDDIKNGMFSPFWDKWQSIRNNQSWQNQAGWLPESPQCKNEYYNPIVMSKMFFLHDSKIWNPFDTDYFLWLDAGITQTVYENYFYDEEVLSGIVNNMDPFLFLSYPYEADKEIHGFEFNAINKYAQQKVDYVCRGGLFGGHKDFLSQAHAEYYHLLEQSINEGLAGTEESVFSIMAKLFPEYYKRYALDSNGLIVKFIEAIKNGSAKLESFISKRKKFTPLINDISHVKTNLYFLTFNYPEQLEATIKSLQKHEGFLTHPTQKIIIDNSTNEQAREGNRNIASKYGFEHISMDQNLGICGGRQFAAEHFDESDSDFYLFFEDDMTISDPDEGVCRNGFNKYIPNLYKKIHQIMLKEKFDFLKLSYTEVYMDNNIQVSWYNVPQQYRTDTWPDYDQLPSTGLDPNCPRTEFKHIEVLDGLSYISGDIYYANWPHITSKEGNKKMFINTKWAHPYEQTWMSHIFQETKKGEIKPAVLLASTVTHDRFKHYKPEERIEG